jgi:hypothetical protein
MGGILARLHVMPVIVMVGGLALFSSPFGLDPFSPRTTKLTPRPLLGVSFTLPHLPLITPELPPELAAIQGQILGIFDEIASDEWSDAGTLAFTAAESPRVEGEASNEMASEVAGSGEPSTTGASEQDAAFPKQPTTTVVMADWVRRPPTQASEPEAAEEHGAYVMETMAVDLDDEDSVELLALDVAGPAFEGESPDVTPETALDPQPRYAPAAPVGQPPTYTRPAAPAPNAAPMAGSNSSARPATGNTTPALWSSAPVQGAPTEYHPAPVQAGSSTGPWPFHR